MNESAFASIDAPAKLNLRLRIFPPGADGYHPLETLFCRISLTDGLRLRRRDEPGVALRVSGGPPDLSVGSGNLVVRAAERFLERAGLEGGLEVELEKRIPVGAGLGGGSSDAAAVLRWLDRTSGSRLGPAELMRLGAELGADVPFFLFGVPMALAWNRGDRMLAVPGPEPRPFLLAVPSVRVSTARAYALWDERNAEAGGPPQPIGLNWEALASWDAPEGWVANDFEPVLLPEYPAIQEWRERLGSTGASAVGMTGSGSAVFAIYETAEAREEAAGAIGDPGSARLFRVSGPV